MKIYTVRNRGCVLHTLTYRGTSGQLVRRQFADLAEAKVEADVAATKIRNGQAEVLQLSSRDRGIFLQALEYVRSTGETPRSGSTKVR